jgi:HlyD family secretion protein
MMSARQRRAYGFLLVLFCLSALLQVAGVASLAPYISLLTNTNQIHENEWVRRGYEAIGAQSDAKFLAIIALCIVCLIAFSNAVVAFITWSLFRFSMNLGGEFQSSIYRSYLRQDYVAFSGMNSASMIAMLTQETPRFVFMVVQPTLVLVSQVFVVVILASVLLYVDPLLALSALAVVGAGYALVYQILQRRLKLHGENIARTDRGRLKLLNESLGGVKEVKLLGIEAYYERQVDKATRGGLRSLSMISLFGDLPKFMLETIAFGAMLGLAAYLLLTGTPTAEIVAVLSLYAMAGYKLLPAAQGIFKAISQIKANQSVISSLYPQVMTGRNLTLSSVDACVRHEWLGNLRFTALDYQYPTASSRVLRDITVEIPKGRITAIVGNSGAGKSTLLDLMLGLLRPSSGSMWVGKELISGDNLRAWQAEIGYIPQSIFLVDDTIAANICFGEVNECDQGRLRDAARLANLEEVIAKLPGGYEYVVGERGGLLSGGQRQRVGIARALYRSPSVLIMDEATSALDAVSEREVMSAVAALGDQVTVILVAHRASTIRYADYVIHMDSGIVAGHGSVEALLERSAGFRMLMAQADQVPEPSPTKCS